MYVLNLEKRQKRRRKERPILRETVINVSIKQEVLHTMNVLCGQAKAFHWKMLTPAAAAKKKKKIHQFNATVGDG